jgi:membrane protein
MAGRGGNRGARGVLMRQDERSGEEASGMPAWRAFGPVVAAGLAAYALVAGLVPGRRGAVAATRAAERSPAEQVGATAAKPAAAAAPRHGWRGLWALLMRVFTEIANDNIGMIAAAVAFYTLMAIFPGLAALVSLYGLVADPADIEDLVAMLQGLVPGEASDLISQQLAALVAQPASGLSLAGFGGALLALISARSGAGALMTALDIAYEEPETRNFLRFNLIAFLLTVASILFIMAALVLLALWPAVADALPIAHGTELLGSWLRWPFLAMLVMATLTFIYRFGPSRAVPCWHLFSWGSIAATMLWLLASAGFSFYVARFGAYDKTYGSIGAVIALLMWLWISAYIILFGAELNREMERVTDTCRTG